MLVFGHFAIVIYLVSLCGSWDTTGLTVSGAASPIALASARNNSSAPHLKSFIVKQQSKFWDHLPLDYLKVNGTVRNFNNFLLKTKTVETDLNSCMKTPTTSCVIRESYIAANNITNAWRRDFSLIFLVGAQTTFGDINGALKTIARIESSSLRLPARLAVAKEHAVLQNIPEAKKITNEVLRNISTVQIAYIRTWVLALSASVFAEIGDLRNANLNIRKAFQSMANIKENSTRAEMYSLIAYAQVGSNDSKGATESIAHAFAEIDKTKDPFLGALALIFVAHAQAKLEQNDNYRRSISMALNKASTLRIGPRALVLSFASSTQAAVGDIQGSERTIKSAINATRLLRDDHSRAPALAFIGKALAQMDSP